jgi:hypothetical protein
MNRYVGATLDNGAFDLGREQTFAVDLSERALVTIAFGGDLEDLDLELGIRRPERVDDEAGLG